MAAILEPLHWAHIRFITRAPAAVHTPHIHKVAQHQTHARGEAVTEKKQLEKFFSPCVQKVKGEI